MISITPSMIWRDLAFFIFFLLKDGWTPSGTGQNRFQMANGKEQISNCLPTFTFCHLPLCHLKFAIAVECAPSIVLTGC
jgi:hypothetical protein